MLMRSLSNVEQDSGEWEQLWQSWLMEGLMHRTFSILCLCFGHHSNFHLHLTALFPSLFIFVCFSISVYGATETKIDIQDDTVVYCKWHSAMIIWILLPSPTPLSGDWGWPIKHRSDAHTALHVNAFLSLLMAVSPLYRHCAHQVAGALFVLTTFGGCVPKACFHASVFVHSFNCNFVRLFECLHIFFFIQTK